jgi:iron-sulfur cluster insertion protein
MLNITDATVEKLTDLLLEENNPNLKLRVCVQGGGCSGMQYGFSFDEEQNEDDFAIDKGAVKILVDSISMQYLNNATIDYKEDLMSAGFSISNPNTETSCGCGSSFSVSDDFYNGMGAV